MTADHALLIVSVPRLLL